MRSSTISCCFFDIVINNFNQGDDLRAFNSFGSGQGRRYGED